ncbi:MAG: M1 family metallopeptidase [Cyclobacteriaceae bacterium]|nr:M1 family metallopeptidase [Cyclobacteriaceae bacterium]
MRNSLLVILIVCTIRALATDPYPRNEAIDIRHYRFQLEVNDSTDRIAGEAVITVRFKKAINDFSLDLTSVIAEGKGMTVSEVLIDGQPTKFLHTNNRIAISLRAPSQPQEEKKITIRYSGIPQDGLIIGKNKFGDRCFFGDNWPDRGRHWLPTIDHPSDKSAVDFVVIAPLHYSVVANGLKIEESLIDKKRKLTHWHEEVPIPVKTMVAGVARFAVQYVGKVDDIPVESWVYPQNRAEGFYDYAVAVKVLDFFHHHIGPYSYKKLANVQSKTRWGGLENANTIFYFENSVTGKAEREGLIAHEEAHQWFGNSATENDWHHVWLSEGFATYLTSLYFEYAYGYDRLVQEEKKDREEVIAFYKKNQAPIIDTTLTDIGKVLSTNTYQKAGWVLHMLRHEMGDQNFWKGLREYYATYKNSNAMTSDFQRIMEAAHGTKLTLFFDQWLYTGGHPILSGSWRYDKVRKEVVMDIEQRQGGTFFHFPLEVALVAKDGKRQMERVQVDSKWAKLSIRADFEPVELVLDPNTWLLFEGTLVKK